MISVLRRMGLRRSTPSHSDLARNAVRAYGCHGGKLFDVAENPGLPARQLGASLVEAPGVVEVEGRRFRLERDGVYRFYRLTRFSAQRLVCQGGLDSMLQMLGYLWQYGTLDEPLSHEANLTALASRQVVLGCAKLSFLSVELLAQAGIEARVVAVMSLDPWNGQDDGHTLTEVRHPTAGWMLYDPSFGCCLRANGAPLSLAGLVGSVQRRENLDLVRLPCSGYSQFRSADGFDYSLWVQERFASEAALRTWYTRVAGVPLVFEAGRYYFPLSAIGPFDGPRFSVYQGLPEAEFRRRFYPDGGLG